MNIFKYLYGHWKTYYADKAVIRKAHDEVVEVGRLRDSEARYKVLAESK